VPATGKKERVVDQTIGLASGHTVGFADYGIPDATAVLWCHGGPGSRLDPAYLRREASEAGLRIIGIDRPGYGLSAPQPGRTIAGWVPEALAVADHLGIGQFAAVGTSTGGAFALALAALAPERVLGVVAWSSMTDGPGSLTSGAAVELYGRLGATVERFTIAGARHDVPRDAKPYVIDGDRYVNEWLGLELTKPAGFRFVELDETWPSKTIVGMERGSERVRVVASLQAPWEGDASRPDVISVGLDTWRIEVESPNPQALRAEVRHGLRLRDVGSP